MIYVDNRRGSKHLAKPLYDRCKVPVELDRLEFGDLAFKGMGEGGNPVTIGIEVKQVAEILDDLIRPRFSGHQLPGLLDAYDYVYLLIEGEYRVNAYNGMLEVPRGFDKKTKRSKWGVAMAGSRKVAFTTYWAHLFTLLHKADLTVLETSRRGKTVAFCAALYRWWTREQGTKQGWETHESHIRHYRRPITLVKPPTPFSLVRRVAAELPSIGRKKSEAVDQHFHSVEQMVRATEEEWVSIEGIGKDTARIVMEELRNGR